MAYRQPGERRERANDMTSTSYLEHFLEQISTLPAKTQEALDQIRHLDDRLTSTLHDAHAAAASTISRSNSKGMPLENARRSYHEFAQAHKVAVDLSHKKVSLANSAHDTVDGVIADIDRRLVEFEAQLKKDGRWLPKGKTPVTSRALAAKHHQQERGLPPSSNLSRVSAPPESAKKPITPSSSVAATRAAQKARNRADATATATHSSRAQSKANKAAAAAAMEAAAIATAAVSAVADDDMAVASDAATGSAEMVDDGAVDTQIYCTCRNVSHGEMIGCEGKDCPYEWFHFECVGLTEAPEGVWLCKECTEKEREREREKEGNKSRRKGGSGRRKSAV